MSKFIKIVIACVFLLIIEIIVIYRGYKTTYTTEPIGIDKYDSKKPTVILVDVSSNYLSVFQEGKVLKTYQIAGGKPTTPSPLGTWRVVNKDTWGEGFGGHWMGFNVPWGKFGIHGTIFPNSIGWNSSKGCIRMWNNDVAELYKITNIGTPVIIWGGPYGNFGNYLRTLKPGMTGSDVYEVQKILRNKGYYRGIPNGNYDDNMKTIVHKYQKDNNLPITDNIDIKFYGGLGVMLME